MKKTLIYSILLGLLAAGCGKKADAPAPAAEEKAAQPCCPDHAAPEQAPAVQTPVETPEPAAPAEPSAEITLVPIPLTLPKPMFVGTPENIENVRNLEAPLGRPRPAFLAPEGVANVALNRPVTSSESMPFLGELPMIVDGGKEGTDSSVVELGPFAQWVVIDLEQERDIYAIVVWHFHSTPRVYFDVAVQVSGDPEFVDAVNVFNNDHDNSLGFGVGADPHYVETSEGRLIDCKGIRGRYVRLWSQGNNQNDYNHYIEVEVYGR